MSIGIVPESLSQIISPGIIDVSRGFYLVCTRLRDVAGVYGSTAAHSEPPHQAASGGRRGIDGLRPDPWYRSHDICLNLPVVLQCGGDRRLEQTTTKVCPDPRLPRGDRVRRAGQPPRRPANGGAEPWSGLV